MAEPLHRDRALPRNHGTRTAFGRSLKRVRRLASLTQEGLAERAGYSATYLGMLERGERLPHASTIETLSAALALAPDEHALLVAAARDIRLADPLASGLQVSAQLAGRALEVSLLEQHLAGEGPPTLILTGEPGMGKTRLLEEAAQRAVRHGWTPLVGGCHRTNAGGDSYAPILDALERHLQGRRAASLRPVLRGCTWLARLLPDLGALDIEPLPTWTLPPDRERHLVFKAVIQFLRNVAGPVGTLLLLDDLQWAGPDALDLLVAISRAGVAAGTPIRVIGAYRHTDDHANRPLDMALADLARERLLVLHPVQSLAHDEARTLLEASVCGASLSTERREQILQRTGGVPFFIVSYAQGMQADPSGLAGADLPWTMVQSIRQRVAALPPAAQALLKIAAVAGREVRRTLLVRAVSEPEAVVLESVEAACRARLLEEYGDGYRFVHDVIREVVEADLSAFRRVVLHRQLTEALEGTEGNVDVEALAQHASCAELPDRAVAYQEQAADLAHEQLAFGTAADRFGALAERLERMHRTRDVARVREKLGTVLATMGRYRAANSAYEAAVQAYQETENHEGVVRVLALIGHAHTCTGTAEAGIARLHQALAGHVSTGTPPNLAPLYAALTELFFVSGRYAEQIVMAGQAADAARAAGDHRALAVAEGRRGVALLLLGRLDEATVALESAVELAEAVGEMGAHCRALSNLGVLHFMRGDFERARLYRERALNVARREGNVVSMIRTLANRGEGALYSGDWVQARCDFTEALAMAQQIDETVAAAYPMLDLAFLSLVEGSWQDFEEHVAEATRLAMRSGDLQVLRWAAMLRAERDIQMGRPQRAVESLQVVRDRPGMEEADITYLLPTLAWALLESGSRAGAATLAAQAVRRARAQQNQVILVEALRVQAMVTACAGERETAATYLDEALSHAGAMPYPYMEARLQHLYATMIDPVTPAGINAAKSMLQTARATFERLSARVDADRALHDLEALPYMQLLLGSAMVITPGQWLRIIACLPAGEDRGRPRVDGKRTVAAILYVKRSGCAWGRLPAALGSGATAHRHFQQWQSDGTWARVEEILGFADRAGKSQGPVRDE